MLPLDKKLTAGRLVVAVVTTSIEEAAIYSVWRYLLPDAGVRLPAWVLALVMAAWLSFSVWLFVFVTGALRRQATKGLSTMVGTVGKAAGPLDPDGMVNIGGELWGARSIDGKIRSGEEVVVAGQAGLKLKVRRAKPEKD